MKFTIDSNVVKGEGEGSDWRSLPRIPDGVHDLVIVMVEEREFEWRACPANPKGACLSLRLRKDDKHRLMFCDIPANLSWMAADLARALGQNVEAGELSLGAEDLVDEVVRVRVRTYTPKSGAEPVSEVGKFLPREATAAPAVREKRSAASQSVKVSDAMVSNGDDDGVPW